MQRHHARNRRNPGFNLVSLMDIFTILVFFLLVNSTDVQVLPNPRAMTLPESASDQAATDTPVIVLTREHLLLDSRVLADVATLQAGEATTIPALTEALQALPTARLQSVEREAPSRLPVTIMSDKDHPFSLIEKVMRSCVAADRPEISLAVLQRGAAR